MATCEGILVKSKFIISLYDRAVTITDVEQLAGAMTEQLAALFESDARARARVMGLKRTG